MKRIFTICVAATIFLSVGAPVFGGLTTIELTSNALELGSTAINHAKNDNAVEADRDGKLITSTDPDVTGIGSILYIQSNGLAGQGDGTNELFVTVTARTHMSVQTGVPNDSDIHAGVIALTNNDNNLAKEGLGVRAFAIDTAAGDNYGKRYVNPNYIGINGHGFQMEGSKEVSGGDGITTWANFVGDNGDPPSNNPPHVDEDVKFDFSTENYFVEADSIKVLLTNIKAGDNPFDLALDVTINLTNGTSFFESYAYLSDAPDVFSFHPGYTDVIEMDIGSIITAEGLPQGLLIDSFIIGAREDPADELKETDEHFYINGFTSNFEVVPEPATIALLGMGFLPLLHRRRK